MRTENLFHLLSKRPLWVFDLDGTLTRPQHDFMAIRKSLGVPAQADILHWIATQPDSTRQRLERQLDQIERRVAGQSQIAPGAYSLLTRLRHCGVRCGVLTRNSAESAEISLKAIGLFSLFDWIIAREQVRPKPDPEGILRLLERAQVTPNEAVMVGDHLNDLQAGRAAGVATVHVDHRLQFAWSEWADFELNSLEEL